MFKKLLCIILCILSVCLTGCTSSKQIDKASIAETVTANEASGQRVYTFYLLSSADSPEGISVPANSFKEACRLAKDKYIPDLSLSKLELLIIEENIYKDVMKKDIEYISEKASLSPLLYVTICDKNTIKRISEDKKTPELIEEQILLLKNKNNDVNINSLSIFNNFSQVHNEEFCVSYINSQNELKADKIEISGK